MLLGLLQDLGQGHLQMPAGHLHTRHHHLPSLEQCLVIALLCLCLALGHPQLFSTGHSPLLRLG